MSTKRETFADYLRRLAADNRESGCEATAEDLEAAAAHLDRMDAALNVLIPYSDQLREDWTDGIRAGDYEARLQTALDELTAGIASGRAALALLHTWEDAP